MTRVYTDEGSFPRETFRRAPHDLPRGVRKDAAQLEADFLAPVLATPTREIRGMVRGNDPIESQAAAVKVLPRLSALERRLLHILATEGRYNARDLENRVEFKKLAPSTVRCRLSRLKKLGKIVQVGRKDDMGEWGIA